MAVTYTGSCKCSAIKISLTGEPAFAGLCHCLNCRKTTGSAYTTDAIFPKTSFTILSGTPKTYEVTGGSGNPVIISFCDTCGATMWSKSPLREDMIVIKTGILDGDGFERIVPKVELFTGRRPKWVGKVDGAVQREEGWKVKGEE